MEVDYAIGGLRISSQLRPAIVRGRLLLPCALQGVSVRLQDCRLPRPLDATYTHADIVAQDAGRGPELLALLVRLAHFKHGVQTTRHGDDAILAVLV
jgi:hypothetical protein